MKMFFVKLSYLHAREIDKFPMFAEKSVYTRTMVKTQEKSVLKFEKIMKKT